MMRCSGSSRDFSMESGEEFVYKNLREESPSSESAAAATANAADINNYNRKTRLKTNMCHGNNHNNNHNNNNNNNYNINYQQVNIYNNDDDHKHHEDFNVMSSKRCSNCDAKRHSLGNGAITGAATISHMWHERKNSAASLQSGDSIDGIIKPKTMKSNRRKNSIGCLNSLSSSPKSPNGGYYTISCGMSNSKSTKSHSLPAHASIKNLDPLIISALRIPSDELAKQLTLLDLPIFAGIQPDELTTCSWTKKEKNLVAPNIVKFTKRFNHISFWTVQEILSGEHSKQRAEILTHFIKVAKKLHELNNLNSLYAIISAMQSASIYRLSKTWSCVSKKDMQSFDRLRDIFNESNHFKNLREYLESLRLPCIPYLGIFLSDLIYIDTAHPYRGGLESEARRNKMNNILRVIANYQQSTYDHLPPNEAVQKYLTSIRFIEELQNIFEEDQYKRSLKLEPQNGSNGPSSSSCSSKESLSADTLTPALACLNISPAKGVAPNSGAPIKFIPGHRKCRSLGSNIFGKITYNGEAIAAACHGNGDAAYGANNMHHNSVPYQQRHLLDDSVLETCPQHGNMRHGVDISEHAAADIPFESIAQLPPPPLLMEHSLQGYVRRKTVQKEGRKATMASWQRYWLQIWSNSLIYFSPKSFKGSERSDFRHEPCKVCPLPGWQAKVIKNTKHKNSFELYHSKLGTVYKFRTDCPQATQLWAYAICKVALEINRPNRPLPVNLMSFE